MKKIILLSAVFVSMCCLGGCVNPELTKPKADKVDAAPTNYLTEIKKEVHDELFREETEETLEITNRIFKHLNCEVIDAYVNGDDALVLMEVTTINAGQAWINTLETYAMECVENLFSVDYEDDAHLYQAYLEEFEDMVKDSNYISIPVAVEMEFVDHRWVWDVDEDVVNAITGFLLAAIDGDINSFTKLSLEFIDDDVLDEFDLKVEVDKENPWSFIYSFE